MARIRDRKKPLDFPTNCPDANDYVPGFGSKELTVTIAAFGVVLVLAIILFIKTQNMFITIIVSATILMLVILSILRNRFQESLIDQLIIVYKYSRSQKVFKYEYFNIYEGDGNE